MLAYYYLYYDGQCDNLSHKIQNGFRVGAAAEVGQEHGAGVGARAIGRVGSRLGVSRELEVGYRIGVGIVLPQL